MIFEEPRVSFVKRPRVDRYGSGLTRAWIGSGSSDSDPTALSGSGGAAAAHGGERRRGRRRQPKTASRARIRARVGLGARGDLEKSDCGLGSGSWREEQSVPRRRAGA